MSKIDQQASIKCPECGAQIDVNDILHRQVEAKVRKSLGESLKKEAREAADDEKSEQIKSMQEELDRQSKEIKDLNKTKAELAREKREKDELKERLDAEAEQKINKARLEIRKDEKAKAQLEMEEKDITIAQLNNKLQDAQRTAERGSGQLQGEVQELAIEKWLTESFPLDTISEIKKGVRGADCLHVVNTRARQNCGTIYYESKRTRTFQSTWIEKFKKDLREQNANVGVIVTETMPRDMDRMGLREGIWICSFEEFKGLCKVLRESVIQISQSTAAQENRSDKMSHLYDYLTSNEFKLQIEAIVEGFTQMQSDLNTERRAMENLWKKREKQIDKVLINTNHMYSSIRGIAGNVVPSVPQLEFQSDNEARNPRTRKGRRRP